MHHTRVPIDQLVKKGQELIVQVTKEGIGAKGPTLTTFVSLPGRSLVMMPSLPKCGVSRKIDDHGERRRLKRELTANVERRLAPLSAPELSDMARLSKSMERSTPRRMP